MGNADGNTPAFVVKAEELTALNYLAPDHPPPLLYEWINRGTDQRLRPTTIDMLLRTLSEVSDTPSVDRLHQSAGLRLVFRTDEERDRFSAAFAAARIEEELKRSDALTAIFDHREDAESVVSELIEAGIPKDAISLLWQTGRYDDIEGRDLTGHSKLSVAASVAGGGVAGALLGVAVIAIPGLGAVAAVGAVATSSVSSVAAVSAAIGATGGAIARMLTDLDVEGNDAKYLARQIQRGLAFVAIDLQVAVGQREIARQVILRNKGRTASTG